MKPSWKIRRRYIFAAFALGSLMLTSGSIAVLLNNDSATSDLITGGVALITLILTRLRVLPRLLGLCLC